MSEIINQINQIKREKESRVSEASAKQPPIGLRPRRMWLEQRYDEIIQAIARYNENAKVIPREWAEELVDLIGEIG